jgi:hypothetical protein
MTEQQKKPISSQILSVLKNEKKKKRTFRTLSYCLRFVSRNNERNNNNGNEFVPFATFFIWNVGNIEILDQENK